MPEESAVRVSPPDEIRKYLGDTLAPLKGWEHKPVWLTYLNGEPFLLKRLGGPPSRENFEYFKWEIDLLGQLTERGFPVQAPAALLGGQVLREVEQSLWATYRFVAGEAMGFEAPLEAQGELLSRLHQVSRSLEVPPRPAIRPIESFTAAVLATDEELAEAASACARHLESLRAREEIVIHGDFTCDNILQIGGSVTGVIDFGMAQHHHPLVDLGFALWHTGRPDRSALELNLERLYAFVSGYVAFHPLSVDQMSLLAEAIESKGLFMIALLRSRGRSEGSRRTLLSWIQRHRLLIEERLGVLAT